MCTSAEYASLSDASSAAHARAVAIVTSRMSAGGRHHAPTGGGAPHPPSGALRPEPTDAHPPTASPAPKLAAEERPSRTKRRAAASRRSRWAASTCALRWGDAGACAAPPPARGEDAGAWGLAGAAPTAPRKAGEW